MTITKKQLEILWGKAAGRCSFLNCNKYLIFEENEKEYSIIGQNAHICSPKSSGPRFDPTLSPTELNSYDNLILLCSEHHKIVDDNPDLYTVTKLLEMKEIHELKMRKGQIPEAKKIYSQIWKDSKSITSVEMLGLVRGSMKYSFKKYYYKREIDDIFKEKAIVSGNNILLIGPPLSGKSRLLYQWLITINEEIDILIPKYMDFELDNIVIPPHFKDSSRKIVILDDIQKYVNYENFNRLFISFIEKEIQVIATCNSGMDLKRVENKISINQFNFHHIALSPITKDTAQMIAKQVHISWPNTEFDGNIGSIFLPLKEIRNRYNDLSLKEKAILTAIKYAFLSGIYEEDLTYSLKLIRKICSMEEIGIELSQFVFKELILKLEDLDFLTLKNTHIQIEDIYLIKIISEKMESLSLQQYEKLINHLLEVPFVVRKIGEQLVNLGKNNIKIKDYTDLALVAYQKIEPSFECEFEKATLYDRFGTAYLNLADIHNSVNFCEKAIKYFKKALRYRTLDNSPKQYAGTQNGLGISYQKLSSIKEFKINSKLSIQAFAEALRIFTLKESPIFYSYIQVNLSAIFNAIANLHKKQIYSFLALEALFNSLLVVKGDNLPYHYGMVNYNLGATYRIIGDSYNNRAQYYKKSIECSNKALTFLDEKYSLLIFGVKETLANTYCCLAETTLDYNEKLELYNRSLTEFDSILTPELEKQNPRKYYSILFNNTTALISFMYYTNDLSRIIEVIEKLHKSLEFCKKEKDKILSAQIYYNLGRVNHLCVLQTPVNSDYCQDAIMYYKKSLKILKKEGAKNKIVMVENQLDIILKICNQN